MSEFENGMKGAYEVAIYFINEEIHDVCDKPEDYVLGMEHAIEILEELRQYMETGYDERSDLITEILNNRRVGHELYPNTVKAVTHGDLHELVDMPMKELRQVAKLSFQFQIDKERKEGVE